MMLALLRLSEKVMSSFFKRATHVLSFFFGFDDKVQVGNDQEMVQSERNSYSNNREMGKN